MNNEGKVVVKSISRHLHLCWENVGILAQNKIPGMSDISYLPIWE